MSTRQHLHEGGSAETVTTLFSGAANALQYGSKQIKAFHQCRTASTSSSSPGTRITRTQSSWFRKVRDSEASTAHLGTHIVTEGSAIPSPSKENAQVTCNYTVSISRQAAVTEVGVILGVARTER